MKRIVATFFIAILSSCGGSSDSESPAPAPTETPAPGSPKNTPTTADSIRIGAFNLHQYGPTKAGKADVLDAIAKIIKRYDLIALQEVRDSTGSALKALTDKLPDYTKLESGRLGTSDSYKESYVFLYKASHFANVTSLQFSDAGGKYEREPFALIADYGSKKYSFVVLHAKPDEVKVELGALYADLDQLSAKSASENVIILGDLNADCDYLSDKEYDALSVKSDSKFTWVIGKDIDTTTGKSDCAYDRIVTKGSVSQKDAGIYKYDSDIGSVSPADVSDHYPVEMILTK